MNSSFRRTSSSFVRFFARDSYSHISGVFAQISFARAQYSSILRLSNAEKSMLFIFFTPNI